MLTPFQERIAAIVAGLDEAEDFALAGGGALIVRGDVDRGTRDLDFFGLTIESVDRLAPAVERALTRAGMEIVTLQSNQGFVRLVASQGGELCEIDLAADARLFPIDTGPGIPTLTGEELAVDKVLAIFGRAEARDFIDLAAVEPRYGFERLCELAAEKDRGFSAHVFGEMLYRFDRLQRREFEIDDERFQQLGPIVQRWRDRARDLAQRQLLSRDRGDDLGLGL
ncbi:MAG: nucleotidyl transferase AbiEii/AbiGii toxin family protein [Acidimicrobiales bacterium]